MSASVLFDAPGPRAKAIERVVSIVSLVLIAGVIGWVIYTLAMPTESAGMTLPGKLDPSRWDIFADPSTWTLIGGGVLNTLRAAAPAAAGAVLLGVLFSLLRSSTTPWIRIPITAILEFLRGMPVLLMMLFILLVASVAPFWAVVIALVLYNGAIIGEALRAGLVALPKGQREAALSVGMTTLQSRLLVEFPQAFRQMLPIIVAQLVVLLKDTSLGYIVAYNETIRTTMTQLSTYYGNRYMFSLFFVSLAIYLAMNLTLSWFARWLARRGTIRTGSGTVNTPEDLADPTRAIAMVQAEANATARSSASQTPGPGMQP